jgi:UDP-N-acetylmuramate--alanine ligase
VVEADEYAGNFDPFRPSVAVVLNAEWDHPDVFADLSAVVGAFDAWLRAPGAAERMVIVNTGDPGGLELARGLAGWPGQVVSVSPAGDPDPGLGSSPRAAVRWRLRGDRLELDGLPAGDAGTRSLATTVRLRGAHNGANAACVGAAAAALGLDTISIATGLASFEGVGRRFDIKGEPGGVLVIDDYGHHPSAIRATLEAVRSRYPGRPVWVAHEPLTYHRLAAMQEELAAALALADHAVIADVWAGRDPDTSIASAAELAARVEALSGHRVAAPGSPEATADFLAQRVQPGEVVLAMGGGRSYVIAERLVSLLAESTDE